MNEDRRLQANLERNGKYTPQKIDTAPDTSGPPERRTVVCWLPMEEPRSRLLRTCALTGFSSQAADDKFFDVLFGRNRPLIPGNSETVAPKLTKFHGDWPHHRFSRQPTFKAPLERSLKFLQTIFHENGKIETTPQKRADRKNLWPASESPTSVHPDLSISFRAHCRLSGGVISRCDRIGNNSLEPTVPLRKLRFQSIKR